MKINQKIITASKQECFPVLETPILYGDTVIETDQDAPAIYRLFPIVAILTLSLFHERVLSDDECGPTVSGADTIACTASFYPGVINYDNTDSLTLNLDNPAMTLTSGSLGGVRVTATAPGSSDIVINGNDFTMITTTAFGINGRGLWASHNGDSGSALITLSGGTINTSGNGPAPGVLVDSFNSTGTATMEAIMSGGTINTTGLTTAMGMWVATPGLGAVTSTMSGGTITTLGSSAMGILTKINSTTSLADVTSNMSGGTISLSGDNAAGLYAWNRGGGRNFVNYSGGSVVTGGNNADGIFARSDSGTYAVDMTGGTISSGSGGAAGIHTSGVGGGTVNITTAATINSLASGVAIRDGDGDFDGIDEIGGNVVVTTAGTVTGDAILGLGDDVFNLTGGTMTGDIYGDDVISASADGNDRFNWSGGDLNSGFYGGNGSDTSFISTASYDGSEVMDGGDDTSDSDGWTDVLTLNGVTMTTTSSNIINWERVVVDSGTVTFSDNALAVGSDAGNGLMLQNGGTLNAMGGFALTGNLINNGITSLRNGSAGDVMTVSGDYSGVGQLQVDVDFDAESADRLDIGGSAAGSSTTIVVNDVTPTGGSVAATAISNDITMITTGAMASGDFSLSAPVVRGIYSYDLVQVGADWILRSGGATGGPIYSALVSGYELYAENLLALNTLSSLKQRRGSRVVLRSGASGGSAGEDDISNASQLWIESVNQSAKVEGNTSGTSADYDTDLWQLKVGVDTQVSDNEDGYWMLGVNAGLGEGKADIDAPGGQSVVKSDSYSLGLTATWAGYNGVYLDSQFQLSQYETGISDQAGASVNNDGKGVSLSFEAGKRMGLNEINSVTFTPQVQVMYSGVDFDDFVDSRNTSVSAEKSKSLKARLGVSLDLDSGQGAPDHRHIYAIVNLVHEFHDETDVRVSGISLGNTIEDWTGELGLGGDYSWGHGDYSVYGEVLGSKNLHGDPDNDVVTARIGFQMNF